MHVSTRSPAPPPQASLDGFKQGMTKCFQTAVQHGYDIAVVPHLDDSDQSMSWRNGVV